MGDIFSTSTYNNVMRFMLFLTLFFTVKTMANSKYLYKENISQMHIFFKEKKYVALVNNSILLDHNNFIDQIYKKKDQVILLKWGIKPSLKSNLGKIIDLGFGFAYCDYTSHGLPYSLIFLDHQADDIQSLIDSIRKAGTYKTSMNSLQLFLGPASWADSNSCRSSRDDLLAEFSNELTVEGLKNLAWSCTSAAKKGSTNKAEEYLDLLNPQNWQTVDISSFWTETVKLYSGIKELIPQLGPLMKNFNEIFKKLNPNFKVDFICASIGAQAIEYLTPGGVIKKIASFKNKLLNLKKLQSSLKSISDLYEKFPESKTLKMASQKIGACAL